MPRERSPNRDRAFQIWLESEGKISNREIAGQLGIPEKTVGAWKAKDGWVAKRNGVLQTKERSTPKVSGAPKGNKNGAGNIGGGAPAGNSNAATHGFFRRIFPDDAETHAIIGDIVEMNPLDILWQNIVIQYTAIARAQRIMFVDDRKAHTQVLKRRKDSENAEEREWEFQFSWDKQANFLQAQSRAMKTLEGLISRYEDLLPLSPKAEEHALRIQKLQAEIAKLKRDEEEELEDSEDGLESLAHAIEESKRLLKGDDNDV